MLIGSPAWYSLISGSSGMDRSSVPVLMISGPGWIRLVMADPLRPDLPSRPEVRGNLTRRVRPPAGRAPAAGSPAGGLLPRRRGAGPDDQRRGQLDPVARGIGAAVEP